MIIGVKCFHVAVDGYRQKKTQAQVSEDECLQADRRNRKKDDWGGFHLKRRLKTKGNLSALKDHSKKIEMKWKTERHRQFWHGERAAEDQQKYNLYNSVEGRLLFVCMCVRRRHKNLFYIGLLRKEKRIHAQTFTEGIVSSNCFCWTNYKFTFSF